MQFPSSGRWVLPLIAALSSLLIASISEAQLIYSKKEVERSHKTQWLLQKRYTPVYPDERVQRYVTCIANDLISIPADFTGWNQAFKTANVDEDAEIPNRGDRAEDKLSDFKGIAQFGHFLPLLFFLQLSP